LDESPGGAVLMPIHRVVEVCERRIAACFFASRARLCRVITKQGDLNAIEHRLFRRRGFAKTGRDHPRTQNNTAKRVQFICLKI